MATKSQHSDSDDVDADMQCSRTGAGKWQQWINR